MVIFVSVTLAGLVFSLVYWGFYVFFRRRLELEQRLKTISDMQGEEKPLLDERLRLPFSQRVFIPLLKSAGARLQRFAPVAIREASQRRLVVADVEMTVDQWSGWCLFSSLLCAALGILLSVVLEVGASSAVLFGLGGLALGVELPFFWLGQMAAKRQKTILRALPDVLDLLTCSVKAGLGFDSALQRVAEKMKGPLSEELAKVLHEIRVGVLRKDALRALADRTEVAELNGFVGTIIQADQLGVSISHVLQVQAETLREQRQQVAKEKAAKAPVKMLFPLVLFIFPTLFIVLLGPALLQILSTLGGM